MLETMHHEIIVGLNLLETRCPRRDVARLACAGLVLVERLDEITDPTDALGIGTSLQVLTQSIPIPALTSQLADILPPDGASRTDLMAAAKDGERQMTWAWLASFLNPAGAYIAVRFAPPEAQDQMGLDLDGMKACVSTSLKNLEIYADTMNWPKR